MNAKKAEIIEFKKSKPKSKPRNTSTPAPEFKYFTQAQIKLLRRTARNAAIIAEQKGNVGAIRDWMAIDLLTSTGMRVAEASDIRCGDIRAGSGEQSIYVRDGKGHKSRIIQIPGSLKSHLKRYINWKMERGESIDGEAYLFIGQRGRWTPAAIQQAVKKYLKHLGLYERGKSVHALRHSYAVELYRQSRDLRAVQKQLGHSSVQNTQIYADVLTEDIQAQLKGIWN